MEPKQFHNLIRTATSVLIEVDQKRGNKVSPLKLVRQNLSPEHPFFRLFELSLQKPTIRIRSMADIDITFCKQENLSFFSFGIIFSDTSKAFCRLYNNDYPYDLMFTEESAKNLKQYFDDVLPK